MSAVCVSGLKMLNINYSFYHDTIDCVLDVEWLVQMLVLTTGTNKKRVYNKTLVVYGDNRFCHRKN